MLYRLYRVASYGPSSFFIPWTLINYFCFETYLNYVSLIIKMLPYEFPIEILIAGWFKSCLGLLWLIKLSIYSLENFRYFNSKSFQ